jgi:ABC-type transport system involved in multi-copper enzyme maturation permease subunit
MNCTLCSEILKQRTTRTTISTVAAMVGVVVLAIALHALGLPVKNITQRTDQLGVFIDVGENVGALFAALLGAIAITNEIRHGTIRPTLLATPQRGRVLVAKTVIVAVSGLGIGALAAAVAAGAGTLFMHFRGIPVNVHASDYALLILGGATAAALWAVIGLGIGAVVRNQVPAIVGMFVWVLFVENLLDGGFPAVGKFAPAALGRSIAGATSDGTLHTPALAALLLVVYATAAIAAGWFVTTNRDVA